MGLFSIFSNKKKKIEDFKNRGAIVLDVRTKSEYQAGAIKGSKHIPLQQLSVKLAEVKKWNKPVITCCASGMRSGSAARILNQNGVEAMNGGGWQSLERKL